MNEIDELIMNYGIVVYHPMKPDRIIHFCGYEEPPTLNDVKSLTMELMTDDEFGLCDHMDVLLFRSATPEEIVWANSEKN